MGRSTLTLPPRPSCSTLQDTGVSPAQLLMGRQLRDSVPAASEHYHVSKQWERLLCRHERSMARTRESISPRFNRAAHTLTPIPLGQRIRLQNQQTGRWDRLGTVIDTPAPRQYLVHLHSSGRASLRNRRHLRPAARDELPRAMAVPHDATQGDGLGGSGGDNAPPSPTPPARPRRAQRAPQRFTASVVSPDNV